MKKIAVFNSMPAEPTTKSRKVIVSKESVYKAIDSHTYKFVEGNDGNVIQKNSYASDTTEKLDGSVVAEFVEYRDAQIRQALGIHLAPVEKEKAVYNLPSEEPNYVYNLVLDEEFPDNKLQPLAVFIHRYLVWGTLFDWYSQHGSAEAVVYEKQLNRVLGDLSGMLMYPSYEKRPLQPFGPAKSYPLI